MRFKAVVKFNQTTPMFAKIKITGLLTGVEARRMGRGKLPCTLEIGEIDGVYLNVAGALCRALSRGEVRIKSISRACYDAMLAATRALPANGDYVVKPKMKGITPMPKKARKETQKKKKR